MVHDRPHHGQAPAPVALVRVNGFYVLLLSATTSSRRRPLTWAVTLIWPAASPA